MTLQYEKQAIEMYKAGKKSTEIEKELQISAGQLYNCLNKNNIELRNPEKRKHTGQQKKNRKCPYCKAVNPPQARFCCMCGKDIRSEADILIDRLNNALRATCKFLPTNCADEVNETIRQAAQYIEKTERELRKIKERR